MAFICRVRVLLAHDLFARPYEYVLMKELKFIDLCYT
jgi:hypothetical protein